MSDSKHFSDLDFYSMVTKIRLKQPFSFSRWGDGEWNAVLGVEGENCDGHKYFVDMGERLRVVLKKPQRYHLGIQAFAINRMGKKIEEWTVLNGVFKEWCEADIIHNASSTHKISLLSRALAARNVTLIGPSHLGLLATWNGWNTLTVQSKNVWSHKDEIQVIFDTMKQAIKDSDEPVFLWSCGMPAKIWIDEWFDFCGDKITQIDTGSVLDFYAGICSRNYHQTMMQNLHHTRRI